MNTGKSVFFLFVMVFLLFLQVANGRNLEGKEGQSEGNRRTGKSLHDWFYFKTPVSLADFKAAPC